MYCGSKAYAPSLASYLIRTKSHCLRARHQRLPLATIAGGRSTRDNTHARACARVCALMRASSRLSFTDAVLGTLRFKQMVSRATSRPIARTPLVALPPLADRLA